MEFYSGGGTLYVRIVHNRLFLSLANLLPTNFIKPNNILDVRFLQN